MVAAAVLFGFGALGWNALVYVSAGERAPPELAARSVAVAATVVFLISGRRHAGARRDRRRRGLGRLLGGDGASGGRGRSRRVDPAGVGPALDRVGGGKGIVYRRPVARAPASSGGRDVPAEGSP